MKGEGCDRPKLRGIGMSKVQRNLWIPIEADAGFAQMAELLGITGQRGSVHSPFYTALGDAFAANPAACAILIRLILDGRMSGEWDIIHE